MTYDYTDLQSKLTKTEYWLAEEFKGIRTGRAMPAILDKVMVSAYGTPMQLNQIANIGTEGARTLLVNPYDLGQIKAIEKAISDADLGVSASSNESTVRVHFPELTGERRGELLKLAKGKLEEARIAVRNARDEVKKEVEAAEKNGTMSKDDKFNTMEKVQKLIDDANKRLEEHYGKKEQEING